jgi:transposase
MSSSDKCKHKTLSAKAEIIKKPENGEKLINLAKEYGVGRATIYDMRKKKREKICGKYRQRPQ